MFVGVVQDDVAGCFDYYADLAEGLDAKQKAPVDVPMDTFKSYVLKEPIGVVGLITPWYLLPLTALILFLVGFFLGIASQLLLEYYTCYYFLNHSQLLSLNFETVDSLT